MEKSWNWKWKCFYRCTDKIKDSLYNSQKVQLMNKDMRNYILRPTNHNKLKIGPERMWSARRSEIIEKKK